MTTEDIKLVNRLPREMLRIIVLCHRERLERSIWAMVGDLIGTDAEQARAIYNEALDQCGVDESDGLPVRVKNILRQHYGRQNITVRDVQLAIETGVLSYQTRNYGRKTHWQVVQWLEEKGNERRAKIYAQKN